MLKRDNKKEMENSLNLVREEVLKGLKSKDITMALNVINKELKALVGLDINTVNTLSFETIKELIERESEFNADKYFSLGEILRLRGKIGSNYDEVIFYYNKSIKAFYEAIMEEEEVYKESFPDIEEMINTLKDFELSLDEKESLFKGYEILMKLDKAEDILFSMIKDSNNSKEIIESGIEFYKRLENLDEEVLERGNLPINEVKDSLSEIEALI